MRHLGLRSSPEAGWEPASRPPHQYLCFPVILWRLDGKKWAFLKKEPVEARLFRSRVFPKSWEVCGWQWMCWEVFYALIRSPPGGYYWDIWLKIRGSFCLVGVATIRILLSPWKMVFNPQGWAQRNAPGSGCCGRRTRGTPTAGQWLFPPRMSASTNLVFLE